MFITGDKVKFIEAFAKCITPTHGRVSARPTNSQENVWIEFDELPQLDCLRLVPVQMLELASVNQVK